VTTLDKINIALLSLSHALYMSTSILTVAIAGLAAQLLLNDVALATLPQAMIPVVAMILTLPAAKFMARLGRKTGFILGATAGAISAALSALALVYGSFLLFLVGVGLLGVYQAFATFYRFAVADSLTGAAKSKSVSLILAGGVLAAVIGPSLASLTQEFYAIVFLGSYVAAVAVNIVAVLLLSLLKIDPKSAEQKSAPKFGFREIQSAFRNPRYVIAVGFCSVGNGAMMFIMTAAPLAMFACGLSVASSSLAISWHVLAMFIPSFFTGSLIARFGLKKIMNVGLALMCTSAVVALLGQNLLYFSICLIINGLAWNFMYIGGSSMLTELGDAQTRPMLQGINEFVNRGVTALGTFASGAALAFVGWNAVQGLTIFACLALLAIMIASNRKASAQEAV